mgnify:FL=1
MNKIWTVLLKPKPWVSALLLLFFFVAFLYLGFMDYLSPIREFLNSDNLSFKFGETHVSVYILTKALIFIAILFWVVGVVSGFVEKRIKLIKGLKESNKALITKAFQSVIYFIAFLLALNFLGIDLTAFAFLGGAIGIGIGFGLQKIASNFISGIILLFEKSVQKDDLIELNDGTFGTIRHTSARYTLIETFDGKEIMIPNEDFVINPVINWTYSNRKGRIELKLGVSYKSDIKKAKELILEAAKEHPRCSVDPEPTCVLTDFADSSVNFLLFFWVDDVIQGRYEPKSDVMFSIWDKFKANGIEIPFPQQDIYIKNPEALK